MKVTQLETIGLHAEAIGRGWVEPSGTEVVLAYPPLEMVNGDAGALVEGDVVVIDTDGQIIKTTTAQDTRKVGVVLDDIAIGESGPVAFDGPVDLIRVTASVTAGQYAETSTTGGLAQANATQRAGSFGIFTSTGTSPSGFLFGGTPSSSAGGAALYRNVVDYGATGDGVTNDTTAIQAAIDACEDYETLFFPVGTYVITSALSITAPIRLLGASAEPNWFHQASRIYQTTANTGAITCTDFEGEIQVENMGIVGAALLARTASSGRGIYTAANLRLKGVQVEGFYDGVYIDDSLGALSSSAYYNHIENCWFHYNTNAGLLLHDQVNNTTIRENYFAFNDYGLYVDGGSWGLRIEGNSFEVNDVDGIRINGAGASQSSSAILILGNFFEQLTSVVPAALSDINIGPTTTVTGVTIEGNHFTASDVTTLWHILLNFANIVTIAGNVIGQNAELGSITSNATNTTNVIVVGGTAAGTVTTPATTVFIDPNAFTTPVSVGSSNSGGTSKFYSRADHVHASSSVGVSPMLADDAASPFTFDDILQNDEGTAWLFPDA